MRRSVARHDREVTPPAPRSPFLRAVRLQPRNADDYSDELPALRTLERIELDPRMHELLDQDGRFVVATHSPVLVGFPGGRILFLDDDGVRAIDYDTTPQVELTRAFLDGPERFLRHLLA
jgi:hypothetical protein